MLIKDTDIGKSLDEMVERIKKASKNPNITEKQLEKLVELMERINKIAEGLIEK